VGSFCACACSGAVRVWIGTAIRVRGRCQWGFCCRLLIECQGLTISASNGHGWARGCTGGREVSMASCDAGLVPVFWVAHAMYVSALCLFSSPFWNVGVSRKRGVFKNWKKSWLSMICTIEHVEERNLLRKNASKFGACVRCR